ncbi:hypothetical protein GYH30_037133 [Glycine max]|uniref:Uncharacterized protein n=2 Tax=Glycine subgen. Soja TaxID=1462606 RepID=K7M1F0_SOYBN|nr:hypothetical protein JHK86_037287 [Glycine max]KAH1102973.1 hypothetical protein GYH30_037133 [Glycine max]RZB82471.1 hypothetical protein D0Y65_031563 [Glycine soja]
MNFHAQTYKAGSYLLLWPSLTILLLLFKCLIGAQVAYSFQNTSVGVVIDANSEAGKQQKRAMHIAAQTFNNNSKNHNNTILFFHDSKPFYSFTRKVDQRK